jgi:glycosyltransferase involved in cell wall biosynthesis
MVEQDEARHNERFRRAVNGKSLVIYLPSMASGGAERLHLNLAPLFRDSGLKVTFLLHRAEGSLMPLIPPGIRVVSLDRDRTLSCLLPLTRFLRRERPDFLLSNLGHNNVLAIWAAALARVPTPIIASHHAALSASSSAHQHWQVRILPAMYRLFLRRAHANVAVSKGLADEITTIAGLAPDRITVIYNPVILSDFDERLAASADHPWLTDGGPPFLLGVGRLGLQKDFKTLLAAFAILTKTRDVRLLILGEGPQQAELNALAASLGIADRVSLPGFRPNPLPFMRRAAALVMSSLYEGFGNVLVEALACGTPVVSTDCPFGPAEILEGGRYGKLVPVGNAEIMASAILATLDRPPPADLLRAHGRTFTAERAAARYVRLFADLTPP